MPVGGQIRLLFRTKARFWLLKAINASVFLAGRNATFPFRNPNPVDTSKPPEIEQLFRLRLILSSDLLSICVQIDNPGHAGCSCPICRCSAKRFKELGDGPTESEENRTGASQHGDLQSHLGSSNKNKNKSAPKPTQVNGVSRPSLLSLTDF